ncbi:unnamed protein product, partial [Effrenium voratum]
RNFTAYATKVHKPLGSAAECKKPQKAQMALFFANFVKMTEVKRFVNFSDGEPAIKSLKEARRVDGVEAIPCESPQGDHQKSGNIES